MKTKRDLAQALLVPAGVVLDGPQPWDPQIHDENIFEKLFRTGSLAVGETYMQGLWDVSDMAAFFSRAHRAGTASRVFSLATLAVLPHLLRHRFLNLQSTRRSFEVGEKHYDIGNDLYGKMLDPTMAYTCAYWKEARTLEEAQIAKLDLVCKKIGLKKGDRIFDAGCGFGSFAIFAAERYGAEVVGVTVSKEQAALARDRARGLPVEIRLQDYRDVNDGPYDHIVSIGLMEHIGRKNYPIFIQSMRRLLKDDGLFLLHTIGNNRTTWFADPWFDKYIFPNGYLPSPHLIGKAIDGVFVMEDWHTFGTDYERTLLAWFENFHAAWPELSDAYGGDTFYRLWKYYLLSMAGAFHSRYLNLWQIVLSPRGVERGYTSVR